MNNSNNNIFGNNNVTPTQQPNGINKVNPTTPQVQQNVIPQANQNTTTMQPQNNLNAQINNTISNSNINPTQEMNNSINNINSATPQVQQNKVPQVNQNATNIQPQNNFNTQMNNTIPNNSINPTPINPLPNNNVNSQSTMKPNQNINNNIQPQQSFGAVSQVNDEDLLRAFIGNNYKEITTQQFNWAGFFFTSLYMFYRKMFGYGLLVFLLNLIVLNVVENNYITLLFNIAVGFLVNKIYISYANKKIVKIKAENPQTPVEELKAICSKKGGTSVGKAFLGFFTELGIAIIILIVLINVVFGGAIIGILSDLNNWTITGNNTPNTPSSTNKTLLEDVSISGKSCSNSKCNVYIEDSVSNTTNYVLSINNSEFFYTLRYYEDYIKLNIYYTQKEDKKTIVDYKIFLRSNNKDISSVKTEDELKNEIGLYSIGIHTDTFTLTGIGSTGVGFKDNTSYTYTIYTFIDSKDIEYEMKYINNNSTLNLVEGNKYNVTFEVTEGVFRDEFTIKSIN